MERKPISPDLSQFPEAFRPLLYAAGIYDSSCSPEARVWYLDYKDGLYLKSAPAGSLKTEAQLTAYFHSRRLSAEVLTYLSDERDWLLTRRIPGEDCTHRQYCGDPARLCDTIAGQLRQLHELSTDHCPVKDRNEQKIAAARSGIAAGFWEPELFEGVWDFSGPEEARKIMEVGIPELRADVLLHGDYCLPNILLDDWRFSGFIDVGGGGIGDRHFDILWGCWTLMFNLKTNRYFDRFLDAYGRDKVHPELLRTVAAIEIFG